MIECSTNFSADYVRGSNISSSREPESENGVRSSEVKSSNVLFFWDKAQKIETNSHIWQIIKIDLNYGTKLYKKCSPKGTGTWISSNYSEFIEDAETGEKYFLIDSSIPISPGKTIVDGLDPIFFVETYPILPEKVRVINVSSGGEYFIKNFRIK